jgi:hypothetical protein
MTPMMSMFLRLVAMLLVAVLLFFLSDYVIAADSPEHAAASSLERSSLQSTRQ